MHPDFFKAMAGFVWAGTSAAVTYFADAAPASLDLGLKGVTSLSVVGGLVYAIKHLNAERLAERERSEKAQERWETKWADEHAENIKARDADRETRETFAKAVGDLAEAVKEIRPRTRKLP